MYIGRGIDIVIPVYLCCGTIIINHVFPEPRDSGFLAIAQYAKGTNKSGVLSNIRRRVANKSTIGMGTADFMGKNLIRSE
jgi:hypothetical protein